MKKIWPWLRTYLLVFALIFGIGLFLNLSSAGETLCVTETWCPDRSGSAVILALLFTLPFLLITAFMLHLVPPLTGWIWDHPQHAFSGLFFFLTLGPIVLLWVDPESVRPVQKQLAYIAIAADLFFGGATIAFANSIPADERQTPVKKRKPMGLLLLVGLFVCMGLTIAAVSDW